MKKTNSIIYVSFILIQSIVYGFGNPLTKVAYQSVTPLWNMVLRFGIAFMLLITIAGKTIVKDLKQNKLKNCLIPGFCMAMASICNNLALNYTSAVNVGFLMSLPVVFVPILEYFILKKPYSLKYLPVQGTVLIGLYLLCSNGGTFKFRGGDILAVMTAVMIAGALVFGERALKNVSTYTVTATSSAITMLISTVGALTLDSVKVVSGIEPAAWAVIFYLAIACTCVAHMLQNTALKHLKSATVSLLQCTQPILTATVAWLLLGEKLNPSGILGGIIIILCIIVGNHIMNEWAAHLLRSELHLQIEEPDP